MKNSNLSENGRAPAGEGVGKAQSFEKLWTIHEVAAYTGMSESWLYRRASAGEMPRLYLANKLRFVPAEIHEWAVGRRGELSRPSCAKDRGR